MSAKRPAFQETIDIDDELSESLARIVNAGDDVDAIARELDVDVPEFQAFLRDIGAESDPDGARLLEAVARASSTNIIAAEPMMLDVIEVGIVNHASAATRHTLALAISQIDRRIRMLTIQRTGLEAQLRGLDEFAQDRGDTETR